MAGMTKEELIEILENEELAEKIWRGWIELENDPVWREKTKGHDCVSILGR
ncbi:MAG: hypothetical protein ACE5KT_05775 [Methanosarcinales archaeon]